MGKFIDTNYQIMKVFLERAVEKSKQKEGADFTYLLNQANLQMLEYPNEYSDNVLREITPMLEDLRRAVSVLENGY